MQKTQINTSTTKSNTNTTTTPKPSTQTTTGNNVAQVQNDTSARVDNNNVPE